MEHNIELKVIAYYMNDKLSANKIAELESIDRKTVYRILKRHDVKVRTISEAAMKYQCNDSFFSEINTEEKAYWLGVLYADGNVSKKASKSGQIFLSSTDKEWVEEFMKTIQSTNKPRSEYHTKFKKIIWKAQITSSSMFDDLCNLGCIPAKSKIIRFPDINPNYYNHFIRGYFDGDGTVGIYKNLRNHDWKILKSGMCSGSKEFLQDVIDILPLKNKKISYRNVYIIQWSLYDTLCLYDYLYQDSHVCLERKRTVFTDYHLYYKKKVQRLQ